MEYVIRFAQDHLDFRKPEIEALARIAKIELQWISYNENSPYAIVRILNSANPAHSARSLVSRSVLTIAIYRLWGCGETYESLHEDVRRRDVAYGDPHYAQASFRFEMDTFQGKRSHAERSAIYDSFAYLGFQGPVVISNPDHRFVVFEEYNQHCQQPSRLLLGTFVADGGRRAMAIYDLRKRSYIATTSMNAELSLVTANMALIGPGSLAYDPFMGTGSFPVSCAHFGATVFGSDMDIRCLYGKSRRNIHTNFEQYGTTSQYLGTFVADLTNTPLRNHRFLDAIVCDPPYGVREGLRVLGSNKPEMQHEVIMPDGIAAHLHGNYIPPRKAYSFLRMLDDILDFASEMLVDEGRLCMWMPVSGSIEDIDTFNGADDMVQSPEVPLDVPKHPALELVSVCTQDFNKWSRRLLTYQRKPPEMIDLLALTAYRAARVAINDSPATNLTADELNAFRKQYFQGFRPAKHKPGLI